MKKTKTTTAGSPELRRQAEAKLQQAGESSKGDAGPTKDSARLLHELQVHQIELEMQNEELRHSRAEVEAGLARYTDLYDFSPMGYLTLDWEGAIREVNLAGQALLGIPRAGLMGRHLSLFIADADRPVFSAFLQKVFATGAKEICELALLKHPAPPVHVRIEATCASEGKECRAAVVDITAHRQEQEVIRVAKAAADVAIKAKDEFLAKLSHELRTPLTPILLAASRWQTQADIPPAIRDDMAMVCRNLELEARLLDDLLDMNRIVYGKVSLRREVVSMHQVISDALAIVAATVQPKKLKLTVQLQAANDSVEGDPTRMRQILWNLLSNAVKFTPEGGRIGVCTANEADGEIRLQITDSGIGMEPAMLSQLFNPFEQGNQQINREYGGMGLGLTICRAMVEAHGGSIAVTSGGKGQGATFTVRLPLTRAADARGQDSNQQSQISNLKSEISNLESQISHLTSPISNLKSEIADRQLRILLVEDHADTARLMSRLLRAEGHAVQTAGDIASAREHMTCHEFDLLISDMGLPDGSGLDLMRALVAAGQEIKAIALSGYGMEEDLRRSREAGFAEHLVKPIQFPQLLAAIQRVVGPHLPSTGRARNQSDHR